MRTYLLRGVPPDLATAFRAQCIAEGRTMRWVLLALIRDYLVSGLPQAARDQMTGVRHE